MSTLLWAPPESFGADSIHLIQGCSSVAHPWRPVSQISKFKVREESKDAQHTTPTAGEQNKVRIRCGSSRPCLLPEQVAQVGAKFNPAHVEESHQPPLRKNAVSIGSCSMDVPIRLRTGRILLHPFCLQMARPDVAPSCSSLWRFLRMRLKIMPNCQLLAPSGSKTPTCTDPPPHPSPRSSLG